MAHGAVARHAFRERDSHVRFDAPNAVPADFALAAGEQTSGDGIAPGSILTPHLDPTATIRNLINGPAEVVVDDTGILVKNGALTLEDEFGKTVMVASGFAGSWSEFLANGLYNASFTQGATDATLVVGRSAVCPYWLGDTSGDSSITKVADQVTLSAPTLAQYASLTSDRVVVRAAQWYIPWVQYKKQSMSATSRLTLEVRWYNRSGGYISTDTVETTYTVAEASVSRLQMPPVQAPAMGLGSLYTAYFAELKITVTNDADAGALQSAGALILECGLMPVVGVEQVGGGVYTSYTPATTNFGGATFTTRTGYYVTIGKLVWLSVDVVINGAGSGAGAIGIGLPIPAATMMPQALSGMSNVTAAGTIVGMAGAGGDYTYLDRIYRGGSTTALTGADATAGRVFRFTGVYLAA